MRYLISTILLLALCAPYALAQMPATERATLAKWPSWTAAQKPVRVYGNTWFVGPRGLSVLLITAPGGHVLIDGGVPGDAPLIEANIRSLGVDLHDIKWILNTHAHFDHAGDLAQLARDTGAEVIVSAADAPLLARGGLGDPQYGDNYPFAPALATRTVRDGETLRLGDLQLTAHATPGHTRGNTTWTWTSCEDQRCLHLVDIGSLSAPDYQLLGNAKYPDIVTDFEHSFAAVAALPCDIALNPHPEAVDFWARVDKRGQGHADALVDTTGCRRYAKAAQKSFEAQLAKQRAKAAAAKTTES
jgi:metallo-beta-lactamase class B